jgi:hypothetical protein
MHEIMHKRERGYTEGNHYTFQILSKNMHIYEKFKFTNTAHAFLKVSISKQTKYS